MKNASEIVEYNLEASVFPWEIAAGKTIEAWGFNKQLAPVLTAKEGDTMIIRVISYIYIMSKLLHH
ncbi:MAG: hypothetical protein ABI772_05190 [Bacteroidota bacterium]